MVWTIALGGNRISGLLGCLILQSGGLQHLHRKVCSATFRLILWQSHADDLNSRSNLLVAWLCTARDCSEMMACSANWVCVWHTWWLCGSQHSTNGAWVSQVRLMRIFTPPSHPQEIITSVSFVSIPQFVQLQDFRALTETHMYANKHKVKCRTVPHRWCDVFSHICNI